MSEQKYYPEDILVEKWKAVNLGGWITSTIIQLNGRKNTAVIAKRTAFPSEMNRQLSLSVIKMLNLKLRWKTEKHRKTTNKRLHNGLWRYEQIPIHGKWICSPKCKRY